MSTFSALIDIGIRGTSLLSFDFSGCTGYNSSVASTSVNYLTGCTSLQTNVPYTSLSEGRYITFSNLPYDPIQNQIKYIHVKVNNIADGSATSASECQNLFQNISIGNIPTYTPTPTPTPTNTPTPNPCSFDATVVYGLPSTTTPTPTPGPTSTPTPTPTSGPTSTPTPSPTVTPIPVDFTLSDSCETQLVHVDNFSGGSGQYQSKLELFFSAQDAIDGVNAAPSNIPNPYLGIDISRAIYNNGIDVWVAVRDQNNTSNITAKKITLTNCPGATPTPTPIPGAPTATPTDLPLYTGQLLVNFDSVACNSWGNCTW